LNEGIKYFKQASFKELKKLSLCKNNIFIYSVVLLVQASFSQSLETLEMTHMVSLKLKNDSSNSFNSYDINNFQNFSLEFPNASFSSLKKLDLSYSYQINQKEYCLLLELLNKIFFPVLEY